MPDWRWLAWFCVEFCRVLSRFLLVYERIHRLVSQFRELLLRINLWIFFDKIFQEMISLSIVLCLFIFG